MKTSHQVALNTVPIKPLCLIQFLMFIIDTNYQGQTLTKQQCCNLLARS